LIFSGDHRLALEQAEAILQNLPDHPDFQLVSLVLAVDILERALLHQSSQQDSTRKPVVDVNYYNM
jgi:hypothetical protein